MTQRKVAKMSLAYFETLNAALKSENLLGSWDSMTMAGISYGETRRYQWQGLQISIYRSDSGRYERPVNYKM